MLLLLLVLISTQSLCALDEGSLSSFPQSIPSVCGRFPTERTGTNSVSSMKVVVVVAAAANVVVIGLKARGRRTGADEDIRR